jgi:hypothetical protein
MITVIIMLWIQARWVDTVALAHRPSCAGVSSASAL